MHTAARRAARTLAAAPGVRGQVLRAQDLIRAESRRTRRRIEVGASLGGAEGLLATFGPYAP
jgi:hypothetical protein